VLTGIVGITSKRSLIVMFMVTGPAPCSGAEQRNKELDEISTAIPGGAAAWNDTHYLRPKPMKTWQERLFTQTAQKVKNDLALDVRVNVIVMWHHRL